MSFLEPLFLAGLLATAIPLVIHLINRRKATHQPFPAMRLLLESNRKEAPSIKARHWLLLALRVLIVAALAFALAKPYILSAQGTTAAERLPSAVVLVVDDSASMQYGDWWKRAESAFARQMRELRPWDEVALITTSQAALSSVPGPVSRFSNDHTHIKKAFDKLAPTDLSADLSRAALAASNMLAASQLPGKYVVLISDFADGGFPKNPTPDAQIPFDIQEISVRSGGRGDKSDHPDNLSIIAVDYAQEHGIQTADLDPDAQNSPGAEGDNDPAQPSLGNTSNIDIWRISATVQNHTDEEQSGVELRLHIDDQQVAGGVVDVPAGKTATYHFRQHFDSGGLKEASVELVDADKFEADNRYYFNINLRERIHALLVNGEPRSHAYSDEMYFLIRALNPGGSSQSSIIPEMITPSALAERELSDYDVVVLSNLARVSPKAAGKLESFAKNGGGLLLTMGSQVDPMSWNQTMKELLPKPLRGMKRLAERDDPDAPLKITQIGSRNREHPIFRVFDLAGGTSLQSAQVYSYMLLEPAPSEQAQQILSYRDSAPAMVERQVGKGRVLLYTSTIDLDWGDLPLQTAYLPLMRRTMQYLARRATSAERERPVAGKRVALDVSGLTEQRAIIRGPDGFRQVLEPTDGQVSFVPKQLGFYQVWADQDHPEQNPERPDTSANNTPKNRLDALAFAVNLDPQESELQELPADAFDPWNNPAALEDSEQATHAARAALAGDERRVNIWPPLLFAITLFLLLESLLGTRRSVLQKLWRGLTFQKEPEIEV